MSVGKDSIDFLKEKANNARDYKECVIYMAESDTRISEKIKELEKNAWKQTKEKPIQDFHFDNSFDSQVQPIVIRKKEKSEDELNK